MSHHGKAAIPKHEGTGLLRFRRYAVELMGEAWAERREVEIAALPKVEWKGKTLHTIRCHGTRGKGPHDVHLPESVLWHLISLAGYWCVYHAGD